MITMKSVIRFGVTLLLSWLSLNPATADVQFAASRVVFDADSREQSFELSNRNDYPVLIQTWVDDGMLSGTAVSAKNSPVITYPAVFKLGAHENRHIRLINSAIGNAGDGRERLYWLNVQIVSPKKGQTPDDDKPELNVSLLMKFKLFYRPHALKGPVSTAIKEMRFQRAAADRLRISNPTPYYVTFSWLSAGNQVLLRDIMLPPGADQTLPTLAPLSEAPSGLNYSILDDSGLAVEGKVPLIHSPVPF